MTWREEEDSLGKVRLPAEAYYGAQTWRAVENFPVSGWRLPPGFIRALARIKRHAASVNAELGLLDPGLAQAIAEAALEVVQGRLDDQFVVDVFQTGSGTSTNMNANEVIAGRANEMLTGRRGGRSPVHPNDHVNLCQSSNDVMPSALHLAALTAMRDRLIPALEALKNSLDQKAVEFSSIRKIGRTHLQDAVPVTLGLEFGGYARQIELGLDRVDRTRGSLSELALGGTAVGTGLNAHPEFAARVIARLVRETGLDLIETADHFEAQGARDAAVEASGALKTVAVSLHKIANDVRWLGSGPRAGLGEIVLPALQPGSSIMPGKINPVIPETVIQVAAQVVGLDAAVTFGGLGGYFELNAMVPLIAHNLLAAIDILASAANIFAEKCIDGIEPAPGGTSAGLERSLALATHLVPVIGYDRAADIAREAYRSGRTIRETARDSGLLSAEEIDRLLEK
ncbi:MAG: class II fumarate hydratase [Proteobacteria bacterium]|nr:class II fumarate hydratase [Pseudomonadota bacterium]